MRFLSVKDVLVSAQVRCSRRWDEDNLWNHALKKRRKKKKTAGLCYHGRLL